VYVWIVRRTIQTYIVHGTQFSDAEGLSMRLKFEHNASYDQFISNNTLKFVVKENITGTFDSAELVDKLIVSFGINE